MVKAAVVVCVMVLGWTWTILGVPVVEEKESKSEATVEPNVVHSEVVPTGAVQTEGATTEAVLSVSVPTEAVPFAHNFTRKEMCSMAPKRGPCKAKLRRHFYNSTSASCEVFFYGGCRGNRNNFRTEEKCLERCGAKDQPTHSPLVTEATPIESN